MGLYFIHHSQDFRDLDVECRLRAEEDVAVGMGGLVAVVHELGIGADLAVVAGDKFEESQHGALGHNAERKGRGCGQQSLFYILAETDKSLLEVARLRLLDLLDVEIDEAHLEHMVGEEGDVDLLATGLEGGRKVVVKFESFAHQGRIGTEALCSYDRSRSSCRDDL